MSFIFTFTGAGATFKTPLCNCFNLQLLLTRFARLHSDVVDVLARNITGFLYAINHSRPSFSSVAHSCFLFSRYASDKSLTELTVSSSSLLLANVWDLTLLYPSAKSCSEDAAIIAGRHECVVVDACTAATGPSSLSVNCGSLTCEGCALVCLLQLSPSLLFQLPAFYLHLKQFPRWTCSPRPTSPAATSLPRSCARTSTVCNLQTFLIRKLFHGLVSGKDSSRSARFNVAYSRP